MTERLENPALHLRHVGMDELRSQLEEALRVAARKSELLESTERHSEARRLALSTSDRELGQALKEIGKLTLALSSMEKMNADTFTKNVLLVARVKELEAVHEASQGGHAGRGRSDVVPGGGRAD